MKIKEIPKKLTLEHVPIADVFKVGGCFYMRMDATKDGPEGTVLVISLVDGVAVRLDSDKVVAFYPDAKLHTGFAKSE